MLNMMMITYKYLIVGRMGKKVPGSMYAIEFNDRSLKMKYIVINSKIICYLSDKTNDAEKNDIHNLERRIHEHVLRQLSQKIVSKVELSQLG